MSRIESFKRALEEKRAVKIIAGIDNFDIDKVKKVVISAEAAGASAVDICADPEIVSAIREITSLPVFVSSIVPEELAHAVALGADAIELGNFDALYKKGCSFSATQVLNLAKRTIELISDSNVFFCVTIPGELEISEQINLARELETMGVDLIQTEGHFSAEPSNGARGLVERAELTLANTIELSRNLSIPVMTSSGISSVTAPMAFAAGASAIGVGSCINKCENLLAMMAAARAVVESVSRVSEEEKLSV